MRDGIDIVLAGVTHRLMFATPTDLGWLSAEDQRAFKPWPSATSDDLARVMETGEILILHEADGTFAGCIQVVLQHRWEDGRDTHEAYCYEAFVVAGVGRAGYGTS